MPTLDQTLDAAMQLTPNEQEMLIDIIKKRRIESFREELSNDIQKDILEFDEGKLKTETAEELINRLHHITEMAP